MWILRFEAWLNGLLHSTHACTHREKESWIQVLVFFFFLMNSPFCALSHHYGWCIFLDVQLYWRTLCIVYIREGFHYCGWASNVLVLVLFPLNIHIVCTCVLYLHSDCVRLSEKTQCLFCCLWIGALWTPVWILPSVGKMSSQIFSQTEVFSIVHNYAIQFGWLNNYSAFTFTAFLGCVYKGAFLNS